MSFYHPEIHEEYLIHDTPVLLLHPAAQPCADYIIAMNTTN